MNLLHMHCNELIAMRLKELTDTLNKIANQGTHDTNNTIIITAVISVVLALVACICITMYINRKYPKKKPDNNNQTNSNQGNTKNEEKLIACSKPATGVPSLFIAPTISLPFSSGSFPDVNIPIQTPYTNTLVLPIW